MILDTNNCHPVKKPCVNIGKSSISPTRSIPEHIEQTLYPNASNMKIMRIQRFRRGVLSWNSSPSAILEECPSGILVAYPAGIRATCSISLDIAQTIMDVMRD
jgi:hypothetical protein